MPLQLKDNGKTHYYLDDSNMMLERLNWGGDGIGDALWRTSLSAIAYKSRTLINSIKNCIIYTHKGKMSFVRHPKLKNNDTSRDQSIMALIALKETDKLYYDIVTQNLSFRISDKFTWQDAWLWAKGKYKLWRLFSCYHFIGWFFEPEYSIHLYCWMLWSSRQKAPIIKWYLLNFIIPKKNYLLRALLGVKDHIPHLKPMSDFIWQRNVNAFDGRELNNEEAEYNTLDIDVLKAIVKQL